MLRYSHGYPAVSARIATESLSGHDFIVGVPKTLPADCQRYVRGSHAGAGNDDERGLDHQKSGWKH